jgi:DNA-binding response OmpR family regulator
VSGRIVVAHEQGDIRDAALRVVRGLGFEGVGVADGESARALVLGEPPPLALVVDVGLSPPYAYQLVDELRAHGKPVGVVLVASVYSRTAYKRKPVSLHGADDYVEQHHVPDQLGDKLVRMLNVPRRAALAAVPSHEEAEQLRRAGEGRLAFRYGSAGEALARAEKLAEVIVADLLLYAGAEADRVRSADDLARLLGEDLISARELLALRVPAEVAAAKALVAGALDRFVAARQSVAPPAGAGEPADGDGAARRTESAHPGENGDKIAGEGA